MLAPLTHAEHAQRLGLVADAEGWSAQAVDAARLPGVPSYLLPLVLLATQRRDEAQVELVRAEQAGTLPDEFLAMLALRPTITGGRPPPSRGGTRCCLRPRPGATSWCGRRCSSG